ncbi:hypothetical protein TRFO_04253 [Tritrichomonas foetus]|uniref:Uncharacterized protein n=1 Tax=Tritrichomonas foetus TaxID=1144522 RepID=A0A1J4KH15_9EUKA|nr:hypothetical protein TRFO_04253 [Tritrichomonas foetus]|eukprot:OHT10248.1 hypothetical protein TRFO_04253 [Tritrichomonas foetus]
MSKTLPFFSVLESVETGNLETDEKIAAINFNFERASFIRSTLKEMEATSVTAQKRHYQQQINKFNQKNNSILERRKKEIETQYNNDIEELKYEYQQKLTRMKKKQEKENNKLKAKWDTARRIEAKRINFSVDNLLDISLLFAAGGEYENAIQFRDTARATAEIADKHPELVKLNKRFASMFHEMSKRHQDEIAQLLVDLDNQIELKNEQKEIEEAAALNEYKIGETVATVQVVGTVITNNMNTNEAKQVLEPFSPKMPIKKSQSPIHPRSVKNSGKKSAKNRRDVVSFSEANYSPTKFSLSPRKL